MQSCSFQLRMFTCCHVLERADFATRAFCQHLAAVLLLQYACSLRWHHGMRCFSSQCCCAWCSCCSSRSRAAWQKQPLLCLGTAAPVLQRCAHLQAVHFRGSVNAMHWHITCIAWVRCVVWEVLLLATPVALHAPAALSHVSLRCMARAPNQLQQPACRNSTQRGSMFIRYSAAAVPTCSAAVLRCSALFCAVWCAVVGKCCSCGCCAGAGAAAGITAQELPGER
jgi:hypothetical protein